MKNKQLITIDSLDLGENKGLQILLPNYGESCLISTRKSQNASNRETSKTPISYRSPERERIIFPTEFILPKTNDTTLNDLPDSAQNTSRVDDCKKSRWKQLSILVKSVHRLKNPEVVKINSIVLNWNSLKKTVQEVTNSPLLRSSPKEVMYITVRSHNNQPKSTSKANDMTKNALRNQREQARFFIAIERGNDNDLKYLQETLMNDPKKHYYSEDDPNRFINKADHRGYTPLYVACRNGHSHIVQLLIEHKANPYQQSKVANKEERESILAVAARWNHIDLVKYLIGPNFTWPQKDIKKAYKATTNQTIKELLNDNIKVEKKQILAKCLKSFNKRQPL